MWYFTKSLLLLVIYVKRSSTQQQCMSMDYQLRNDVEVINITSPNYPNVYQPGTNCRHRITAPMDHVVILSCFFEVLPNICDSEYFLISLDGDLQFRDGQRFCRTTQLTQLSHFRSIALAYSSLRPNTALRGRFSCQARARRVPCRCGWSLTMRIANGQEARHNEFPSTVALRDVTSPQRVFCGGSIISHRHILTAAHCTNLHPNPDLIMAYAGDHDLLQENETPYAQQYRIQSIINHPDYRSNPNLINDIAILITRIAIEWSRGVGPICLPWRQQLENFAFSTVDVAGWGTLSFAGAKSNTLQKIQQMILENSICEREYNSTISPGHLCSYDYQGLGQDSCQYDSGGPVMLRQMQVLNLVGVISFGRSCGQRYGVAVNTRITSHLGWIWRYTENDVCVL